MNDNVIELRRQARRRDGSTENGSVDPFWSTRVEDREFIEWVESLSRDDLIIIVLLRDQLSR